MKNICNMKIVYACIAVVFAMVGFGDEFYWTRGGNWGNYADGASWTLNGTGENPDRLFPGEDDWIFIRFPNFYFDLGGGDHTVKGFTYYENYDPRNLGLRNGSLTVTESFTNWRFKVMIKDSTRFSHAKTASSCFGQSGARNRFLVESGGELQMYGKAYVNNSDFTIDSGAKAIFDFEEFAFDKSAQNLIYNSATDLTINTSQDNQGIFNSGDTSFPNGFTMKPRDSSSAVPPDFRIRQIAGTMTIGGDMVWERPSAKSFGTCDFHLDGGKLKITGNTRIYGFNRIEMSEEATVEIEIAEGKTLDLSEMVFLPETVLDVSGERAELILGNSVPETLNMTGAGMKFTPGGSMPKNLSINGDGVVFSLGDNAPDNLDISGEGAVLVVGRIAPKRLNLGDSAMTVKFTSHVELEEVEGYENAVFEIASPKGVQINSKDEEFKSYILDQVQLPDGWASERNDYKLAVYPEASSRYYYIQPEKPNDFSDLSIWRTGEPENLLQAESFPGYADYIHPKIEGQNTHFSFHLNGVAYKIRGMNYEYAHDYPAIKFDLYDNGSFEFVESFVNRRIDAAITEGSRLIIGRDCTAEYQWQGAINYSRIKNGGRFDALGVLKVGSWQVINDAGGVVNFDPVSFTLTGHGWHTVSSGFENSGNMNFPNGLVINSTCTYLNQWGPWIFRQKSGVMRFGGPLVKNNTDGHPYCFDLSGGTLAVDADLAMEFFDYVGMSNENTTASIDVAEGKTLTWTNAAFAAGTRLYKKGAGTLRLGADVPELVVSNGILRVEGATTVEKLSLASGATFVFAAEGAVNLGDVEMEEGSMFSIDESLMRRRYVRVLAKSSDAEMLEAVCARMVVPESYAVQVAGDELRIVNKLGLKVIVR